MSTIRKELVVETATALGIDEVGARHLGDMLTMPLTTAAGQTYPLASYIAALFDAPEGPEDILAVHETLKELLDKIQPPLYRAALAETA
jgi:hypothetical protein